MLTRRLLISTAASALAALAAAAPAPAAPANDDFDKPETLFNGTGSTSPFDLAGASYESPFEPSFFGDLGARHTVWFKWTPQNTGGTRIHTCVPGGLMKVFTGSTLQTLDQVTPAGAPDQGCEAQKTFVAQKGVTYRIVVDHSKWHSAGSGVIKLTQRVAKPVATFPDWPLVSGKTLESPLRTSTWQGGFMDEKFTQFVCELDGKPIACNFKGPSLQNLTQGKHTLTATARDQYGNHQDGVSTKTWVVDATPPVLTPPWKGWSSFSEPPSIAWQASEANVSYKCSLDYGDFVPCKPPFAAPDDEAPHALTVSGTDLYGNVSAPIGLSWMTTRPQQTQPPAETPTVTPGVVTPEVPVVSPPPVAPQGRCGVKARRGAIAKRRMTVRVTGGSRACRVTVRVKEAGRLLGRTRPRVVLPGAKVRLAVRLTAEPRNRAKVRLQVRSR